MDVALYRELLLEHRPRHGTRLATPLVALLLTALACSGGNETAGDWPLPNYDHSGTRARFDSKIDSGNVDQFTEAWRYELPRGPGFGAAATTPIVIDGTVYIGDLLTNVHAVDLLTGRTALDG